MKRNAVLVVCVLLVAFQLADCFSRRRFDFSRRRIYVARRRSLAFAHRRRFGDTAENENNPIKTDSDETSYIHSDQADDELMQMAEE
uniref:Uncharacterized protein n=1 Tax=Ciona intestinalis TaxID=7719 RepID=H2XRV9_CIOIN